MTFVNDQVKLGITDSIKIEKLFIVKHADIYERYPWIVKKITRREDLRPLFVMIKKLEDVEKGKTTLKETETKLGEALAKEYVYPKIKHLDKEND
tara:strand:+ start:37 stop:321 length:285 start_codon:yes stop_codon:yes gene_type:complete